MKKIFFIALLYLSSFILKAQTINLFHKNKERGYVIYASNIELYPISISLDLDLSNLIFSEGKRKIFVIPPKNEKFKIGELTAPNLNSEYKFSYKFKSALGDVTISKYDECFIYDLPFQKGKSYKVYQGYNGTFSHKNENAIDFTMPEGTEILAARDGIIVQVVQNNTKSCPEEECKKYNNYLMVMHSDGTFANYAHIKYNGSKFKLGDSVKRGDVIAYSGNVGWSSGPHLHFVCFLGGFEKWNTIETKFRIDKGDKSVLLKEGNTYTRDY